MEAIKAVPLQICTATGCRSDKDHAHMAIVMTTPEMRTPTSGKQGCPEQPAKEMGGKQMRRTKGASRSRDRGIRCAAEEGRRRAGGGKMKE